MRPEDIILRDLRLLERSYARGEISEEEYIFHRNAIFYKKTPLKKIRPKRHPSKKKVKESTIQGKLGGAIVLLILALLAISTYLFVFNPELNISLSGLLNIINM